MKEKWKILCICMIFVAKGSFSQVHTVKGSYTKRLNPLTLTARSAIPADFAYKTQGFICKKEWKMESASKIPFRFRLGSIDVVDRLEGKPNARQTIP